MSRHAIRTSVVTIATAAIFALGASAAAARTQIPVYDGPPHAGKNPLATPASILWTGDSTGMFAGHGTPARRPKFGRLHWSKWTATVGRATGANWLNDCLPYCAAGKWTPFNVNLTVYRPRTLLGHKVFTRIKVAYTGKVPRGFKRTGIFTLAVMNKVYLWNFPV